MVEDARSSKGKIDVYLLHDRRIGIRKSPINFPNHPLEDYVTLFLFRNVMGGKFGICGLRKEKRKVRDVG